MMSDDRVEQLAGVVASLVQQVNRLTARLDVALELLAEARLTGAPDNAEIINERLARADAAAHINLSGAAHAGGPAQGGSPGQPESRIQDGTVTRRVVTRNVLPDGSIETVEQIITEGYSEQAAAEVTSGPRTTERALDILDSLGKRR
jgi:hypothetical protein